MEPFQEFVGLMSSQLPDHYFLENNQATAEDVRFRAAYLWSLLQMVHDDLNALCRRSPNGTLGPMSIQTMNKAFAEVRQLIRGRVPIALLRDLDPETPSFHADAIVLLAFYRASLRCFRVEALDEHPYSF